MHDQRRRIFAAGLGFRERTDRAPPWLRDTSPRHIEARQRQPRRRSCRRARRHAAGVDQFVATRRMKCAELIAAPFVHIENRTDRRRGAVPAGRSPPTASSPPGRVNVTLSDAISAVTSSEFGRTTTPCINSSTENSTKSCRLMKPCAGGSAVTTSSVSPASGSVRRCNAPGRVSGMVMLARRGSATLRRAVSGCDEDLQRVGEGQRPVSPTRGLRPRRRQSARPVAAGSAASGSPALSAMRSRLTSLIDRLGIAADRLEIERPASLSNTSQTASARRNKAHGVGALKAKRHPQAIAVALDDRAPAPPDAAIARRGYASSGRRRRRCRDRAAAPARRGSVAACSAGGAWLWRRLRARQRRQP